MKRFPAFLTALFLACFIAAQPAGFGGQPAQALAINELAASAQAVDASSASSAHASIGTQQFAAAQPLSLSAAKTSFSFKNDREQSVYKGKSKKLAIKNAPAKLYWHSSNKKIATVTQEGVVKGKRNGFVTITAENLRTGEYHDCYVRVYEKRTQAQARKIILGLKSKAKYREGKPWTDANTYFWDAANAYCSGCIAFAGIASDKAFGKYAPLKVHSNFKKIKVGDHIRIGGYHSVVVLYKKASSVKVVEGNFNSSMHWGRVITRSELRSEGFEVWTRY